MNKELSKLLARSDLNETLVKNEFGLACRLAKQKKTKSTVQTLAFVLEKMAHGGTERVANRQIHIFHQHGYKIVLITEIKCNDEYGLPPDIKRFVVPFSDQERRKNILNILLDHSVDTVFFTDYWDERTMQDIVWARLMGFNVIAEEHNSFFMPLFSNQLELFKKRREAYSCASILTCLNTVDEKLWHASGIPQAVYVPNPATFDERKMSVKPWELREDAVVIVGRLVHLKGIYLIPKIIQLVTNARKDVKFYICGSFAHKYDEDWFHREVSQLGIEDKILHLGQTDKISDFMSKVKVHVLPSYVEGSPMVIGEARSLGTPTVVFSMPYVDNAQQGCVHVPTEDLNSMACEVIKLISDKESWIKLSNEARSNLDSWSSDKVWGLWSKIFQSIREGTHVVNNQCEQEYKVAMDEFHKAVNLNYNCYKTSNSDPRIQVVISWLNRLFPANTVRRKVLRNSARLFYRLIAK